MLIFLLVVILVELLSWFICLCCSGLVMGVVWLMFGLSVMVMIMWIFLVLVNGFLGLRELLMLGCVIF